jgi:four helix bundle protein
MKNEKVKIGDDEKQLPVEPVKKPQNIQDRTFEFACRIVTLHEALIKRRGAARSLANQLLRSGTSVGSNLQEASVGHSKADFIAKCVLSLKEARETQFWLRIYIKCKLMPEKRLAPLLQEAGEIVAILMTIIRKSRATPAPES